MGEEGISPPDEVLGASDGLSVDGDASFNLDFIDELFGGKEWLEIPGCSNSFNQSVSSPLFSPFDPMKIPPLSLNDDFDYVPVEVLENTNRDHVRRDDPADQIVTEEEERKGIEGISELVFPGYKKNISSPMNPIVDPMANFYLVPSVKERLTYALMYIKEYHKEGGILVQFWVPVEKGGQHVLTTCGQPFWLDHHCQRLVKYRSISTNYHFSAVKSSRGLFGLPGRVFIGKVPEWTPDVRFFSSNEYPRVDYAKHYDVRGSLAVPVFERASHCCLGVLEIVMINEKIDYDLDLESICNALQAVDLRSSDIASLPHVQVKNDLYYTALPEISEVLRVVCQKHKLPLAQTWVPCIRQGKRGTRHSDENYRHCVSTVDSACYVNDTSVFGFHKACSEHHLFIGQGLVGHAFTTNQPCFSSDITALSKTRYPLSHHARIFKLRGAVAIRLRSIHTETADFVLEFFLPINCIDYEMQRLMLNSLSSTIQEVCWTLRVVTEKELADEKMLTNFIAMEGLPERELCEVGQRSHGKEIYVSGAVPGPTCNSPKSYLMTATNVEAQYQGKPMYVPGAQVNFEEVPECSFPFQEDDTEMCGGDLLPDPSHIHENLVNAINVDTLTGCVSVPKDEKRTKKKRGKAEKVISLEALRQHFAGSLKDAAKSLGVCPTTLKRICRAHGISRWPSRKIRKVGNSLQKLQKVIDSVQGVEGSSHLDSLYSKFSKVSKSDILAQTTIEKGSLLNVVAHDQLEPADVEDCSGNSHSTESSHPSSTGDHSCSLSRNSSSGSKQHNGATNIALKDDLDAVESGALTIERIAAEKTELHRFSGVVPCTEVKPDAKKLHEHQSDYTDQLLRVKAVCGEDMVRLRLQSAWGLQDLKLEIARRFNVNDLNMLDLKYLDDDSEWVLLTCDADLHECVDVHKSSSSDTIKITVRCNETKT